MLETFIATLTPMMVMFLCIVIGFVLKYKKILPDNSDVVMSKLENYVFLPALNISTFMTYCTVESIKEQYTNLIYSLIALVVAIGIAVPLSKLFDKTNSYKRNIYKYALAIANFGFMGNAIVPAILGATDSEILYKYLLFTLPITFVIYTWGMANLIPRGEKKGNSLKSILNPGIISVFIGVVLGLTGINTYMPEFIKTAIDYCKACMGPVAMILTGFVVASYSFKGLVSDKKVYVASVLRLFILPAIILAVLKLVGAPDLVLVLALFAYATPLGLNTVVFPVAYGGEPKTGAAMAMISHTLCVVSIPIMYALLTTII